MLPLAVQDLDDIVEYLAQFHAHTGLNQFDRIISKINELPHFPEMYAVYEAGQYRFTYRKIVVDRYLVFYVVLENTIEIHRILHESRNISRYLGIFP